MLPASVLLLTALASAPAHPPFAQVVAEASQAGHPILLDVYTDWCEPCQAMERDVFPRPEVQAVLAGFRFQRYDAEAGEGIAVAERFGINNYPALLVLTPEGTEVDRVWEQSAPAFAARLSALRPLAAVRGPFTEAEAARRPRDAALLYLTGRLLQKSEGVDSARAQALFIRAEAADAGNRLGVAERAGFERLCRDATLRRAAADAALLASYAERYPGSSLAVDALRGLLSLPPEARPATLPKLMVRVAEALAKAGDVQGLEDLTRLHFRQGDTAAALRVTRRWVKLQPEDSQALWMLAEAHYRAGERAKAVALQQRVVALLPGDPDAAKDLSLYGDPASKPPASSGRPFRNPLTPSTAPAMPPAVRAQMLARAQLGKKVSAACADALGATEEFFVRLYARGGRVERAVLLDPEAPAALSECVARTLAGHEDAALDEEGPVSWPVRVPKPAPGASPQAGTPSP